MQPATIFVLLVLALLIFGLVRDRMRPGMILFSGAVTFMAVGILRPSEMLEGFANKGMITVAMLFLVSEGVRRSGLLEDLLRRLLPGSSRRVGVRSLQARLLPFIAGISAFLNNTPVVVIFAPMIKRWAESVKMAPTKLLIPLSYATILGGMCTLIGTSTNLVVHGMVIDSGHRGFTMFELGQIGLPVAIVGILYLILASKFLLPDQRPDSADSLDDDSANGAYHRVEVVLGARFPAINRRLANFDFKTKYGATIVEIKRGGNSITRNLHNERFHEGDTLVLLADSAFMKNWGDSSFFLMVSNGHDAEPALGRKKRWLAVVLMLFMIFGALVGELPAMKDVVPGMKFDMFFFVSIVTVIMALLNIFPARKYTKFISWDILITIASAFAISRAMQKSGVADAVAEFAIGMSHSHGPYVLLALLFVITNVCTELMTNNAAAALAFPIGLAISQQLGVNPEPFFVAICVAASSSFCTPIGYQTNLIVQGIGNYKFQDFIKVGLPLNLITLALSVWLIPQFWPF